MLSTETELSRKSYFTELFRKFQNYDAKYEEELYRRIADEMKNKTRLEKKLLLEQNKKKKFDETVKKVNEAKQKKEEEMEAQRQIEIELQHQKEEAETRALGKAMLADVEGNRPSLNQTTLKVLNNFQGKLYKYLKTFIS